MTKPVQVALKPAPQAATTKAGHSSTGAAKVAVAAVGAKVTTTAAKPGAPVPSAPKAPAASAYAAGKAGSGKKGTTMMPAVQTLGAAFMEQREQYVYNSLNRRDPFASLVSGSFEGEVGTPLLDVSSMKLVGIVWGASDKFALVEDSRGHGFVLRVGDPVLNGYIAGLTKEELIVKQSSYGDTQTVTIQLQRKDGAPNAN